jgi:hypothetical protein
VSCRMQVTETYESFCDGLQIMMDQM